MQGYKQILDRTSSSNVIYIGKAAGGSSESDAVWSIKKITLDSSSNVTSIEWADGSCDPVYAWDDRLSLEYK